MKTLIKPEDLRLLNFGVGRVDIYLNEVLLGVPITYGRVHLKCGHLGNHLWFSFDFRVVGDNQIFYVHHGLRKNFTITGERDRLGVILTEATFLDDYAVACINAVQGVNNEQRN
jgi:hypothetical protein